MKNHYEAKRFGKEANGATEAGNGKFSGDVVRDSEDEAFVMAFGMVGNAEEAKELVQEAYYRLAMQWGKHDRSRPTGAWLRVVMRNMHYDKVRRGMKFLSLNAPVDGGEYGDRFPSAKSNEVEATLERAEIVRIVREVLQGLRPKHRRALKLHDMDGAAYRVVAQRMGVAEGTVKSRVSRAREAFRKRWTEAFNGEVLP